MMNRTGTLFLLATLALIMLNEAMAADRYIPQPHSWASELAVLKGSSTHRERVLLRKNPCYHRGESCPRWCTWDAGTCKLKTKKGKGQRSLGGVCPGGICPRSLPGNVRNVRPTVRPTVRVQRSLARNELAAGPCPEGKCPQQPTEQPRQPMFRRSPV